jgi:methyltransferase (TIGR00027 family)
MNLRLFVAATVFAFVETGLLPLMVIGYVIFGAALLSYSRHSRASATVLASFYTRWMQHHLGTRLDEPCERIMRVLPNVPPLGLQLTSAPARLAHRMSGYVPRLYRYPYPGEPPMSDQPAARTTFFDAALQRHLEQVEQVVILGAGLDTRVYRLPATSRVRFFEVDTPQTQAFKLEMLQKAGLDTTRATYVAADFLVDSWLDRLVAAGFQPEKQTVYLWESVTMYLDQAAVEATLRTIASTAPGSVVAFDYLSRQLIEGNSLYMRYARAWLSRTGETWRFGIDSTPPVRPRVAAFVANCGLELVEQRNFGHETERKRADAGFCAARVPMLQAG